MASLLAGLGLGLASAAAGSTSPQRPNLVLVTLDTTRADRLGSYGWPHARTPNLDALAARGTRFARCDSAAPITLPSHATILTGLFPPRHGVRDNGTFVLAPQVETLAERLAVAGYDSAAAVSAVVLARRHGLDQGFRRYDDDLGAGYAAGTEVGERDALAATDAALALLAELRPPFLLWVHYFDPHEEYRPPSRLAEAMAGPSRLYDGEIAYVDEQLGRLLERLPSNTVVAVVGDHGEMLGEHGEASHGLLLFAAARRVPLLLAGPGVPAAAVEEELVRTADLAPTLAALAGVEMPAGIDGRSLLPLPSRGGVAARSSYSESFLPFFAYKWFPLRAWSDARRFYLAAPRPSLFAIAPRLDEQRDLAAREPAVANAMRRDLEALLARAGERLEGEMRAENALSDEQRRALASLGYLAGASGGAVTRELPDPRERVEIAAQLSRISREVGRGRCREVESELRGIVARDPRNFPALSLAGYCFKEAGRVAEAKALFERASRENELSAVPVANLAGCYLALGDRGAAEREYRRALTLDATQTESATNLARLLRDGGRRDEALAVLERAHAAGARAPAVFLERGLAAAEAGRVEAALADFREAARRDPANPVPLENAARAAYRLGQKRAAAQLYEQLLRLESGRGDLWKTLGAIYLYDLEDAAAARVAFARALSLESDPAERRKLEALLVP